MQGANNLQRDATTDHEQGEQGQIRESVPAINLTESRPSDPNPIVAEESFDFP